MQQKNMNVYATAHLSGDVANAVTLLKRMTRPSSRKHKAGLLIPSADLAACQVPTLSDTNPHGLRNITMTGSGDLSLLISPPSKVAVSGSKVSGLSLGCFWALETETPWPSVTSLARGYILLQGLIGVGDFGGPVTDPWYRHS